MSRKESREALFQLVFEMCFNGQKNELSLENTLAGIGDTLDKKYVTEVYNGISEKYEELASEIGKRADGFSLERIFKVDLAIMLLALYEIRYYKIPTAVAINEAVELAKKYSTEKSATFVNGVLASLVK